jgi:hypothetical protein
MADHRDGVSAADRHEREHSVVAGAADNRQLHSIFVSRRYPGENDARTWGVRYQESSDGEFLILPPGMQNEAIPYDGTKADETETGVAENDRAGKAVAERIRAATAGLLAKAGRMGERLRGMAEDVGLMQRENAVLNERVSDLSTQVLSLSEQLRRLSGN